MAGFLQTYFLDGILAQALEVQYVHRLTGLELLYLHDCTYVSEEAGFGVQCATGAAHGSQALAYAVLRFTH
jgi:hypothetical protein